MPQTDLTPEQRRPTEARLEAALRAVESANRCEVGAMLALYHCAKAILPDLIAEVRELREDKADLDWLGYTGHGFVKGTDVSKWTIEAPQEGIRTIRAAIRAARATQDTHEEEKA
jgi:hypothetical protein